MYCEACLSANRKLSSPGIYKELYINLLVGQDIKFSKDMYLCWECLACLRKLKQFHEKVKRAQDIMKMHILSGEKEPPESLSNLGFSQTERSFDFTHADDPNIATMLSKEYNVKLENSDYESDNADQEEIYFDNIEMDIKDINLINLKDESKDDVTKEIKKKLKYKIKSENKSLDEKKKMEKAYKFVRLNRFNKRVLFKRIEIPFDEIEVWLNKEKTSKFYKNSRYKCTECVESFMTEFKFKEHIRTHIKVKGKYNCRVCTRVFRTHQSLIPHENMHRAILQCLICGYQCYTKSHMNYHTKAHRRCIRCKHCNADFEDVVEFQAHYKAEHKEFFCDNCGKKCKSKKSLEKHIRNHYLEFRCEECGRKYKNSRGLWSHMYSKHGPGRERAYCVPCGKQYSDLFQYRRHIETSDAHAHERPAVPRKTVSCPECGNTYTRKTYMMNHYRHVHQGSSRYYCEQCDKHYLNNTSYSRHIKYHHQGFEKEKNNICSICGRGFTEKRILANHMMTHTGERPHECATCGARFTQKQAMQSHVKHVHLKLGRRDHCRAALEADEIC